MAFTGFGGFENEAVFSKPAGWEAMVAAGVTQYVLVYTTGKREKLVTRFMVALVQ